MNYKIEPIILNTDDTNPPEPSEKLWENRVSAYQMYVVPGMPKCSIVVMGYNRLNKTRYCVECILKYTKDIDYELILIDNGSDDGTYEFFKSVPYGNKHIVRVTKNVGSGFPFKFILNIFKGEYLVCMSNDLYVTQNWLSNLFKCYESDNKIGFVEPTSSNVSNNQQIDINYSSFEEMQEKAAELNCSDPAKWEERMRLIGILGIFSKPILDIVGINDLAFAHDFSEDDICARIRRAGYKLVLCRDTWICHDHDFRNMEDKDPAKYTQSLINGRAIYREKYYGIDPWDDMNNYEYIMLSQLKDYQPKDNRLRSLVIDGRCGAPVLEIRNHMRQRAITDIQSYGFTTQAKYYLDLQTIADNVQCDRIDFIQSYYPDNAFDIVVLCEPVNLYPSPITLLQRIYNLLKPNGVLLFKLRNTDDYKSFMRVTGIIDINDSDFPAVLPLSEVQKCLQLFGGQSITMLAECEELSDVNYGTLFKMLSSIKKDTDNNDLTKLITMNYVVKVIKG